MEGREKREREDGGWGGRVKERESEENGQEKERRKGKYAHQPLLHFAMTLIPS